MPKILVVDDEAIITMQLEERLHAMGYTVAGMAATGEDAIAKARRLSPDLILMDIVMPGKLNGIEAAAVILSELDIPVIFVTLVRRRCDYRESQAGPSVWLYCKTLQRNGNKSSHRSGPVPQGIGTGDKKERGGSPCPAPRRRILPG